MRRDAVWTSALLVAATLVVAAAAWAQTAFTELAAEDVTLEEPIVPLGPLVEVELPVQAPCRPGLTDQLEISGAAGDAPAFVNLLVTPLELEPGGICPEAGQAITAALALTIALTQDAPAFVPLDVLLAVTAVETTLAGTTTEFGPATATLSLQAGYFNLYNVRLDDKVRRVGPQEAATFPIAIDNFSNADTRFEFALADPDAVPEGFQPVVPEPIVLQSKAQGGRVTTATVAFQVYTPFNTPYTNEVASIALEISSMYARDPTLTGPTSEVATTTQARGVYASGPGIGLVVVAALAAVAVLVVRRRRGPD